MYQILLVDDEIELNGILKEAIEQQLPATKVQTAASLDDALKVVQSLDQLDLLVVDYYLGDQTGIELTRALRARFPDLPTLLYTGKAGPEVAAEAERAHIKLLWKPLPLGTLLQQICSELPEAC